MTAIAERATVVPLGIPSGDGVRRCALLVLHGGGLTGLGEAAAGDDLAAVCAELAAGRPRHPAARAAWSAAELDLRARDAGVPAAELLGGVHRRRVRCAWRVGAVSPAGVAREVEAAALAGFATFELPARGGGGPFDLERLGAARWAAGREAALRLDLGGVPGAALLTSLQAFRLQLVLDPLPAAATAREWRALGGAAPVALAASVADPARAAGLVAVGISLAIDPALAGGPAAAHDLAGVGGGSVLLRSAPVTSVGLAAVLHVACALPAGPPDCGLAAPGPLEAGVTGPLASEGPWLALDGRPGLGVELDAESLTRYRLDR